MVFWSWWKTGGSRFSNGPGPSLHLRKAKSHIWLWSPPHTHTHQAHAQKVQLELASLLLNRYVSAMPILLVSDNLWLQAEISYSKPKNMVMVTIILKCFPTSSSVCLSSASFWEGWKVMPVLLLRRIGCKRERLNITESLRCCVATRVCGFWGRTQDSLSKASHLRQHSEYRSGFTVFHHLILCRLREPIYFQCSCKNMSMGYIMSNSPGQRALL